MGYVNTVLVFVIASAHFAWARPHVARPLPERPAQYEPAASLFTAEKPVAKRVLNKRTIHGVTSEDYYAWIKDESRENEEVRAYLEAENRYTSHRMATTAALQERLVQEVLARRELDETSFPTKIDQYLYYARTAEGSQYPRYYRRLVTEAEASEQLLLDVNELARGHEFYSVTNVKVSPNHQFLAYAVDSSGAEKYTIRFKNLETGDTMPDAVHQVVPEFVWANDSRTVFFATYNDAYRQDKIWSYALGQPQSRRQVFYEADENFDVWLSKTKSGQYILLSPLSMDTGEVWFINADRPNDKPTLIQARRSGHIYTASHHGSWFYIQTNLEALNYRIVRAPVSAPSLENWTEFIPHNPNRVIGQFPLDVYTSHLVVYGLEKATPTIDVYDLVSGSHTSLNFHEEVFNISSLPNDDFNAVGFRFEYSSPLSPDAVKEFRFATGDTVTLKEDKVKGDWSAENYVSRRLWARARDGALVPISMVHKKGLKLDGQNPLLAYGYGSYGYTILPSFDYARLSLLDRGVVFAAIHVRGSNAMGTQWYYDGRLRKKTNTFHDFIDATEHLIRTGYTSAKKIAANGRSAGGLLMGAIANMRPDLYQAVIAEVPFVDVVNTMLDPNLRYTTLEYLEWGNPNNRDDFNYMLSYDPYENVRSMAYPNMLLVGGYHDTRVNYWEPAKLAAKIRHHHTGNEDILLLTQLAAGHGGGSGILDQIKEDAFRDAFILDKLGLNSGD